MAKRLDNFDVEHHDTFKVSFAGKMGWWKQESEVTKQRCKLCWVRIQDCFCKTLLQKREELQSIYSDAKEHGGLDFKVLMYYHYMEIGRSANTAHVFEALCPSVTEPLIFGDVESENKLIEDIHRESLNNEPITCLMYPAPDAMLLSDWMASRPNQSLPIRLVALDGTYPMARRQVKYLNSRCQLLNCKIPLVKLDLKDGACKSAIAGIMSQPGKDKICTFQALVMAMRQININSTYCDHLTKDLEDWLIHILRTKIKFGKAHVRTSVPDVDNEPSDFVLAVLRDQPPPTADGFQSKIVREVLSGHVHRAGRSPTNTTTTTASDTVEGYSEGSDYEPVAVMTFDAELVTFSEPTVLLPSTRVKTIKLRKTNAFSVLHF